MLLGSYGYNILHELKRVTTLCLRQEAVNQSERSFRRTNERQESMHQSNLCI